MQGIFVSFEGGDGCGKSTQIRLFEEYCKLKGFSYITTREPGGTMISERIRDLLLDPENSEMSYYTEALLFAASRAQHVDEKILPALEDGKIVICDRFMDSSIVYQGYARGLGDPVRGINEFAVHGVFPNLTFFLKLDPSVALNRVSSSRPELDRLELEGVSFQQMVYQAYLSLCEIYPDRIISIDASQSIECVAADIRNRFDEYVARRFEKK